MRPQETQDKQQQPPLARVSHSGEMLRTSKYMILGNKLLPVLSLD